MMRSRGSGNREKHGGFVPVPKESCDAPVDHGYRLTLNQTGFLEGKAQHPLAAHFEPPSCWRESAK